MIRYLLDTDVTSQGSKTKPNAHTMDWLETVDNDELAISVITLRERLEDVEIAKRNKSPVADELEADAENLAAAFQIRILVVRADTKSLRR